MYINSLMFICICVVSVLGYVQARPKIDAVFSPVFEPGYEYYEVSFIFNTTDMLSAITRKSFIVI